MWQDALEDLKKAFVLNLRKLADLEKTLVAKGADEASLLRGDNNKVPMLKPHASMVIETSLDLGGKRGSAQGPKMKPLLPSEASHIVQQASVSHADGSVASSDPGGADQPISSWVLSTTSSNSAMTSLSPASSAQATSTWMAPKVAPMETHHRFLEVLLQHVPAAGDPLGGRGFTTRRCCLGTLDRTYSTGG